jgi:hypothetical protein
MVITLWMMCTNTTSFLNYGLTLEGLKVSGPLLDTDTAQLL